MPVEWHSTAAYFKETTLPLGMPGFHYKVGPLWDCGVGCFASAQLNVMLTCIAMNWPPVAVDMLWYACGCASSSSCCHTSCSRWLQLSWLGWWCEHALDVVHVPVVLAHRHCTAAGSRRTPPIGWTPPIGRTHWQCSRVVSAVILVPVLQVALVVAIQGSTCGCRELVAHALLASSASIACITCGNCCCRLAGNLGTEQAHLTHQTLIEPIRRKNGCFTWSKCKYVSQLLAWGDTCFGELCRKITLVASVVCYDGQPGIAIDRLDVSGGQCVHLS